MGVLDSHKPTIAMIVLQCVFAGVALLPGPVLSQGLSSYAVVVYMYAIAALIMSPLAYFSRRKASNEISLGVKGFLWLFMSAQCFTLYSIFYFKGIGLSSSTMAGTLTNTVPAVTFILATCLGMEKINIHSLRSIAKLIGTVICVSGAISMALMKGPTLLNSEHLPIKPSLGSGDETWLLGSFLLIGSSCLMSVWLILQVPLSKRCPDYLYSAFWICVFGVIQSATLTIILDHNPEAWKPQSNLGYACLLFVGSATPTSILIQAYCVSQRGPLFSAMFGPLCTVIVTILAAVFLHERIYLGSLVGTFAVIIGVYVVLWGKAEDIKEIKQGPNPMPQAEQTSVQVFIDEPLGKNKTKIDLAEPLLFKNA